MNWIFRVTLLVASSSLFAATLSQPSYQITLDDGWVHTSEQGHRTPDSSRDLISIRHPNRNGVLKIQSFRAPGPVDRETLRTMTNVAWSEPPEWQAWGEFAGYQYSYFEGGMFYRQWWLTYGNTIVFLVHSAEVEQDESGQREIDKIVRSIAAI